MSKATKAKWRDSTWGDEISLEYGKSLRGYDTESGRYRVYGSNGPIGWTSDYLTTGPGVILGRKGAYRGVEYSTGPFFVIDTAYYVRSLKDHDMRWLYYAIKQHKLGEIDDGSPIPSTTRSAVYITEFPVPPLSQQQAIACILGALDDKIELNRRRNRTLEAMARAIFQSWFVDFDPVKAKAAGRKPAGMSKEIAALFPASFEDSALGAIPKGWRFASTKDFAARIQYGFTTSATQQPSGPKFLRITDIRGGMVDWNSVPYCEASEDDKEKYRIIDGDIVVARTGASTGENTYLVEPPEAVFASYLVRFQFDERGYARVVGEFMRSGTYFAFVKSALGGSAQPNANAQTLAGASLVFPPVLLANKYYQQIRPLDLQRATQDKEARTLAALRDALLPKLISGELRVPDAERIVGRAV